MDLTVSHVFLTVDDQDKAREFYHRVLGLAVLNDVEFEGMRWQEPIDQPYGVRDCAFRDPFGNMLRFSEQPVPA